MKETQIIIIRTTLRQLRKVSARERGSSTLSRYIPRKKLPVTEPVVIQLLFFQHFSSSAARFTAPIQVVIPVPASYQFFNTLKCITITRGVLHRQPYPLAL